MLIIFYNFIQPQTANNNRKIIHLLL